MVLCHISHVYETGCSLYFTVAQKAAEDPLAAVAGRQGRGLRRDHRGRRDDHPPPRRRHRPQAVAGRRDRRPRRLGAPRGQGRPRPDRGPQPGSTDPVTDNSPRSFTFLVNPASGGGAAPAAVVPVAASCSARPAPTSTSRTRPAPRRWARWWPPRSTRATSSSRSAATGCCRRSPGLVAKACGTLGVVPAGRGNDFARMLGLPEDPAALAALLLEQGRAARRPGVVHAARGR